MIKARKRDTRIPRKPFLWLTAALLFTLPPMFGAVAIWVPVLFLTTLLAKFWMEPRDYRLRSSLAKLGLGALTLVAVFVSYGSINGIEPGVSIVVVFMALKILEAHTAREFEVMVAVGWVLCLCGFFLAQDLAIALCLLVAFVLLVVALIEFNAGSSFTDLSAPIKTGLKLLAQTAPLAILLFLFFPRINTGFRVQLGDSPLAGSGFSGQLSPGSVSALANSSATAFRAEFPDGRAPRSSAMYWRGTVLLQGNGLEWRATETPAAIPRPNRGVPVGKPIRQWITLEPHGSHWMFALDWPADAPPGAIMAPGSFLWSGQPIRKPRKYEVRSFPELRNKELRPREKRTLLSVPPWISPSVRGLATSFTASASDPKVVVNRALDFFRTQDFRYSLSPGEYKPNDLDDFLFRRRIGFCEHYAASFATLMRLAGIPARVVIGYLGGEYNEIGQFFIVRQADAHAWCEVWLPETGWTRIDPTSVVAPDRVNFGLTTFLERRANAGQDAGNQSGLVRNIARLAIFNRIRLAWQTLNYTWDTHILSFDSERQDSLLSSLGLDNREPLVLLGIAGGACAVLLAVYFGWSQFRTHVPRDTVKALYNRFCAKVARLGAARIPSEGPSDFCNRAGKFLPDKSGRIRQITNVYIALRYSAEANPAERNKFADEVRAFERM
jgi:transglutaminase-like putative cysteine protease